MRRWRVCSIRILGAIVVACAIVGGACSLGPKQDDPLTGGGVDTGVPQDATLGPDGGLGLDSSSVDTGKTSADGVVPLGDCDGGDGDGCVPEAGDADAPVDAPVDAGDAPSDAVDDGDAVDAVVGG